MSYVEGGSYHVGHGAMHYLKVKNDEGEVEKKILIDAGSNQDDGINMFSPQTVFDDIYNSKQEQCIFCLTHLHADHYAYFNIIIKKLFKRNRLCVVDRFYVGSVKSQAAIFEMINNNPGASEHDEFLCGIDLLNELITILDTKVVFMDTVSTIPKPEWVSEDGDVELHVLFNCLFNDDVHWLNANSANYLLRKKTNKRAFWVTGDITGRTFDHLWRDGELQSKISYLVEGYNVTLTVPHHGSLHTMLESDFIKKGNSNPHKWFLLCFMLGLRNYSLILNSCFGDRYGHPSGIALGIYSQCCAYRFRSDSWMVYKYADDDMDAYKQVRQWFGKKYLDIEGLYLQTLQRNLISTIETGGFMPIWNNYIITQF